MVLGRGVQEMVGPQKMYCRLNNYPSVPYDDE
jgi:hypothetical protein